MSGSIIKLENVSWAYFRARDWALKNISITIGEGEFVAVMGKNGAGKTTFCRLLNGLIPHSLEGKLLGTVTVDGVLTTSCTAARLAEKTGMAFEDPQAQLFTARVSDEIAFAPENMRQPAGEIREKVRRALDIAGLSACADYAPSALSGGQKQRLAIAAAVAQAEKILVLDEPASQLDPAGAREVLSFIRDLRNRTKLTVVMATNSGGEAAEFADRICVLKNGTLAALDSPRRIFADQRLLDECAIAAPLPRFPVNLNEAKKSNPVPVIQLNHLHYRYNSGNFMLCDINLAFMEHELTAVIGQNGCGKTTLLKNISGLARPSRGNILLRGRDTADMDIADIAAEVGLVMQEPDRQLFESTVYDEVTFALKHAPPERKLAKSQIREKAEEALSMVGLLDKRDDFPPALGRADRVKTVFAAILAMGPKIIMLDEPFAGQDRQGCRLITDILANLHRQGYTILMVTHNINVIAEHAQRIIVMKDGAVFKDGTPREILTQTAELAAR